jgi:hypothetical protein
MFGSWYLAARYSKDTLPCGLVLGTPYLQNTQEQLLNRQSMNPGQILVTILGSSETLVNVN